MMNNRTIKEQKEVEASISDIFRELYENEAQPYLYREEHIYYLYQSLLNLQYKVRYYDTGHPWIIYWILHSLNLLDDDRIEKKEIQQKIIQFLSYCQHPQGGFCGGHAQLPQVASTYAAVLSLLIIGTEEAYSLIDRKGMYDFFMKVKNPDGSFRMAERGEIDMRGTYIAVILSSVLNIQTPELLENVGDYIGKCQTYEGGIGPVPESEAHGGLTFCAIAALCEMKQMHKININKLIYWSMNRQMKLEGGFQGRTNKLVDCCYSFWQGAMANLLAQFSEGKIQFNDELINNQRKLQMYCLICQHEDGGLFDKPGKHPDLYHTCYSLSGLSLAQKRPGVYESVKQEEEQKDDQQKNNDKSYLLLWEGEENKLNDTDPIFNINPIKLQKAREYFSKLPGIKELQKQ